MNDRRLISQGSSAGFRPGVFVFDDDVDWARMLKAVLSHLTGSGRTGPPAHVRIKSGDILRDSGFASALSYGPFVENEGRTLRSWQEQRRAALDRSHEVRLREILDVHDPSPKQPVMGSPALVFSHIDDVDLTAIRGLGEVGRNLIAHGRFDPRDPVVANLLWGQMLPAVVVSHGRVLERLEDEPELEESGGTLMLTNPTRSFVGEAIFYEAFDETIYTDERALGWDMPDPLPIPDRPPQHDTPVGQVLRRIEDRTGPRISSQDRREDGADVSRTLAFDQYPNPNEVERKVRSFLLDPGHEKQRWVEFADHGLLDRGVTALLVASSLSSVFLSPFPAADIRPTADAALQFTVPVALPTRRGHLLLTTSWTFRDRANPLATADLGDGDPPDPGPASGLWLATAHPNPREDEYGYPFATAFHEESTDWSALAEFVETVAVDTASSMLGNAVSSSGALWIPRGTGRQEAFFKWARRYRRPYTFTRKGLGGPVLAYDPLRMGRTGETERSAALRTAQILLGMAGIRSYVQLHFD